MRFHQYCSWLWVLLHLERRYWSKWAGGVGKGSIGYDRDANRSSASPRNVCLQSRTTVCMLVTALPGNSILPSHSKTASRKRTNKVIHEAQTPDHEHYKRFQLQGVIGKKDKILKQSATKQASHQGRDTCSRIKAGLIK